MLTHSLRSIQLGRAAGKVPNGHRTLRLRQSALLNVLSLPEGCSEGHYHIDGVDVCGLATVHVVTPQPECRMRAPGVRLDPVLDRRGNLEAPAPIDRHAAERRDAPLQPLPEPA